MPKIWIFFQTLTLTLTLCVSLTLGNFFYFMGIVILANQMTQYGTFSIRKHKNVTFVSNFMMSIFKKLFPLKLCVYIMHTMCIWSGTKDQVQTPWKPGNQTLGPEGAYNPPESLDIGLKAPWLKTWNSDLESRRGVQSPESLDIGLFAPWKPGIRLRPRSGV